MGDWFLGMLPLSILLVLLVPWLAYVLYPPVLKSGDQVPRWQRRNCRQGPALFA
ncbi:anion permease [Escherichia coli]